MCLVCYSIVLLGRETDSLQLLAPLLLTGGKGADLMIRGNVVLNTLSACSTSTLLQDQICINSPSSRQVSGLAELSYATGFDSLYATVWYG
jgi:CHAT domain-containing protein